MAVENETDPNSNQGRVRDLLTPELRRNFEYIYKRLVTAGIKKMGLTPPDAEDFAQDAIVHALERRDRYTPKEGVPAVAWLLSVARNRFIDRIRRQCVEEQRLRDVEYDRQSTPREHDQEQEVLNEQAAERRNRLIQALSDRDRKIFMVWVEQNLGRIDRAQAVKLLEMQDIAAYEAAKKRVRRSVMRKMAELGYEPADLVDEEPRVEKLIARASHEERA